MANKIYPKYKAAAMSGGANVNLLSLNVKLIMIDLGTYTYSDAHEFLSDIVSGSQIGFSGNLASKSVSAGGAFQSANGRFDAITGVSVEALIMFVDTGVPATSRLVAFFDTGITGIPVTPAGTSYNIIVDPSGWFIM